MKSVLLIEDTMFLGVMETVLQDFEVTATTTLEGAFHALRQRLIEGKRHFNLIVLDLGLPDSTPEHTVDVIPELIRLGGGARLLIVSGYPEWAGPGATVRGATDSLWKLDEDFSKKLVDKVNDLT